MKNRRPSIGLIAGAALAAASLAGAGSVSATTLPTSATKCDVAPNAAVRVRRSYQRRMILAGGSARVAHSAFLTKGNRAQRQRQLAGMMCKNG